MVSWIWILVSLSVGAFIGLCLSALFTSGSIADIRAEAEHWRKQAVRMATRFGVDLPLGPGKGE